MRSKIINQQIDWPSWRLVLDLINIESDNLRSGYTMQPHMQRISCVKRHSHNSKSEQRCNLNQSKKRIPRLFHTRSFHDRNSNQGSSFWLRGGHFTTELFPATSFLATTVEVLLKEIPMFDRSTVGGEAHSFPTKNFLSFWASKPYPGFDTTRNAPLSLDRVWLFVTQDIVHVNIYLQWHKVSTQTFGAIEANLIYYPWIHQAFYIVPSGDPLTNIKRIKPGPHRFLARHKAQEYQAEIQCFAVCQYFVCYFPFIEGLALSHIGSCTFTHRFMHIHTSVHMHSQSVPVYPHIGSCTFTHRFMYIHTSVHLHSHIGSCISTHRFMYIHNRFVYIHTSVHVYSHIGSCIFTHRFMHIHPSVYAYSHIGLCAFTHRFTNAMKLPRSAQFPMQMTLFRHERSSWKDAGDQSFTKHCPPLPLQLKHYATSVCVYAAPVANCGFESNQTRWCEIALSADADIQQTVMSVVLNHFAFKGGKSRPTILLENRNKKFNTSQLARCFIAENKLLEILLK